MSVRDLMRSAREAALELRDVRRQARIMRDRLFASGHDYSPHGGSYILDPMRRVDELVDWETVQVEAIRSARRELLEAEEVVNGVRILGNDDMADTLQLHYLKALDWSECARMLHQPQNVLREMDRQALDWCESQGIARLRDAGRYAKDD